MARTLALTVRMQRLVESLAERQRLLERLSKIQASIVRRRDLDEVFEAIVAGAQELLGDETVALRLIDPEDPAMLNMVASAGIGDQLADEMRRSPLGQGAGGRAAADGRLIVIEDYAAAEDKLSAFAEDGIRAALGAPVREKGEVVGSLVVATHRPGRTYSRAEREMLVSFAEHASLALNDAKTVEDAIHQAFHDSLTGLPNRQLLIDRLEHALARAARTESRAAVLFVDLDTFKNVNDSLGHAAGDELLREAARRLVGCVRAADTAARFGGDEFVVLLEDVDTQRVARVANRILEAMGEPFVVRDREVFIGASIGIAIGGDESDDLLRNADLALYRAKSKGKGQKQVYEPEMHVAMVDRLELEESLAQALRGSELTLHYQPIIELRSERLAGVEALVRWMHPTRGLLLPGEFIPMAEDSRLMLPLGRWVLRTACLQAAEWRRRHEGARDLALSVNFSSAQFSDATLVEGVRRALIESGLPADRLVLELTETALFHDPDTVADRMLELKRLGVRARGRRLRHRKRLAPPPGEVPGRCAQGRPLVRQPDRDRPPPDGDRRLDHRPRQQPRDGGDRRGDRDARPARPAARARLRLRPGLLPGDADGRRRPRTPARASRGGPAQRWRGPPRAARRPRLTPLRRRGSCRSRSRGRAACRRPRR